LPSPAGNAARRKIPQQVLPLGGPFCYHLPTFFNRKPHFRRRLMTGRHHATGLLLGPAFPLPQRNPPNRSPSRVASNPTGAGAGGVPPWPTRQCPQRPFLTGSRRCCHPPSKPGPPSPAPGWHQDVPRVFPCRAACCRSPGPRPTSGNFSPGLPSFSDCFCSPMPGKGIHPTGCRMNKSRLTLNRILAWADDHKARTGRWPSAGSGPVGGTPGETWAAVNAALALGRRGLSGGDSLSRLLKRERGAEERRGGHLRSWSMRRDDPPG
jgi:hypothetical protein